MSELPEIHEIGKLRLEPGDVLVIRNTELEVYPGQAAEIKEHVRRLLRLTEDFPILVLGRGWAVGVATIKEI